MAIVGTAYIKIKAITTDFRREADQAYEAFRRMTIQGYAFGPAIAVAVGGLSSMVSGLTALTSQVAAALPSLIVLPSIFSAIGQAAITAKMAFSGIGAAMKSLTKKGGGGGGDNSKRVAEAERRLAEVLEQNREALARANDRLTEAEERLTKARQEASESLQQLNFDAEDAAISEKKAAIELEKARETLARVQDLPPNSRARREAELAYQEADLNMRRAKDRNADLAKETEKRNKLGVEGQEEVVDAQKAVQEAVDARAKAELDALKRLIEAQERLEEARKGSGGGSSADAEALNKLSAEARAFAEYLVSIQPKLVELRHAAGKELFGPLTFALDNLVTNLFPALQPILQKTGKALGKSALDFSKIVTEGKNLEELTRITDTNADTTGKLGIVFGNLYDIMLSLLDAADPLIRRFTDWIVTLTTGWKETRELRNQTGELRNTFTRAGDIAAQLGRALGKNGLFGAIKNIGKAASGPGSGGEMLLDTFEKSMKKFDEFTKKLLDDGSLKQFFIDASENFSKISTLIVEIVKEFLKLGDDESIGKTADALMPLAGTIGDVFEILQKAAPAMGDFVTKLGEFLSLFAESQSIEMFFGTLETVLDILIKIFSNDIIRKIALQVAMIIGVSKALSVVGRIGRFVFMAIGGAFGKIAFVFRVLGVLLKGVIGYFKLLRLGIMLLGVGGGVATGITIAIAALYAAIALAIVYSQKLRDALKELWEKVLAKLKDAFDDIKGVLDEVFGAMGVGSISIDKFKNAFRAFGDFLAEYWVPYLERFVMPLIDGIKFGIMSFIYAIGAVINAFKAVYEIIRGVFSLLSGDVDGAKKHFGKAFGSISNTIEFAFKSLVNTFKAAFSIMRAILAPIITIILGLVEILKPVFNAIWGIIKGVIDLIVRYVQFLFDFWKGVFNKIWPIVNKAMQPVLFVFKTFFKVVKTVLGVIFNVFKTVFRAFMVVARPVFNILRVLFVNVFRIFMKGLEIFKVLFMMVFNIVKAIFIGVFTVLKVVFKAVWGAISWGVKNFGSIFSTVFGVVKSVFSTVFGFLKSIFDTVWPYITTGVNIGVGAITTAFGFISSVFSTVFNALKPVFEPIWNAIIGAIDLGVGIISGLFDKIGSAFAAVFGTLARIVSSTFSGVVSVIEGIINAVIGGVEWGINLAITAINGLISAYNAIPLVDNIDKVTKITLERVDIDGSNARAAAAGKAASEYYRSRIAANTTYGTNDSGRFDTRARQMALGGTVSPTPGGVLAVIGEAGRPERVEPLDPDGLSRRDKAMIEFLSGGVKGGITMNVYPSEGMNETELASKISRELALQLRRGAA